MTTYLKVKNGKIEIHADMHNILTKPDFVAATAAEAAQWMFARGITDWVNSSTMDWSDKYGWPTESARDDVVDELWRLRLKPTDSTWAQDILKANA